MKYLIATLICLLSVTVFAANPTFSSFLPADFTNNGTAIGINPSSPKLSSAGGSITNANNIWSGSNKFTNNGNEFVGNAVFSYGSNGLVKVLHRDGTWTNLSSLVDAATLALRDDTILVSPGLFDYGLTTIDLNDRVHLKGSGLSTILASSVNITNNCTVEDMVFTNQNARIINKGTGLELITNVWFENLWFVGTRIDAFQMTGVSGYGKNINIFSQGDAMFYVDFFTLEDSRIEVITNTSSFFFGAKCISGDDLTLRNVTLIITNVGGTAVLCDGSFDTSITLDFCTIRAGGGATSLSGFVNTNGTWQDNAVLHTK